MAKITPVNLSNNINTFRNRFNRLVDSVGDLALLNTDSTATIVGAINSVDSNQGTRTSLTTSDTTNIPYSRGAIIKVLYYYYSYIFA